VIKDYFKKNASGLYIRLIVLTHLLFSYNAFNGWWYSLTGTFLIILLARRCWSEDYLEWIGLKISLKAIIKSLILLIFVIFSSYILISLIAENPGVSIKISALLIFIHIIGYTLNEEILLGAILLKYIQKRFVHLKKFLTSVLVALVFSVLHYVFYRWIFLDKGILSIATLVSLFAIGIIRNNLILSTGHIGYSWALHAGWVFIMFGFVHIEKLTGTYMNEPCRFNLYLGSSYTTTILLIVAFVSLGLMVRKEFIDRALPTS
jgi:hypothetical protein